MLFLQKIIFSGHLGEGEKLLYVAHKHWIEIVNPWTKTLFFGIFLPWFLYLFLFPANLFFWITLIWSGVALLIFFTHWLNWYFDAWLVTNVSVIDIEWKNFFHRLSQRIEYDDIEEIAYEIKGFWGTFLHFGNMVMNLSNSSIALENINSPKKVELKIHKIREEFLNEQKFTNSEALHGILSDLIAKHIADHGLPKS